MIGLDVLPGPSTALLNTLFIVGVVIVVVVVVLVVVLIRRHSAKS